MPEPSIRARLIFLSVLLLAILGVSSMLLIRELARESETLTEEAHLVSTVRNANTASKHFGDLKYWITDSAATQLDRSKQNAAAAKARLDTDLKAIAPVEPAGVAAISREVATLSELARQAGDALNVRHGDRPGNGHAALDQRTGADHLTPARRCRRRCSPCRPWPGPPGARGRGRGLP